MSVLLENLVATLSIFYKSSLRNHITLILESGTSALWLVATLFLIKYGKQQSSTYIYIRIIALWISLILMLWVIWRSTPLRVNISIMKWALRSALPFAVSELLAWASMRVDVLVIAFLVGEYATGLYSPAVGLVNALFLIPSAVYLVITPVLSNLFVVDTRQAWVTAKNGLLLLAIIGLAMSTVLMFGAGLLVSVLGVTFQEVREVLRLLSPVLFIHSLTFGLAAILVATNQQANRTIVQSVAVATKASLNLLLVSWIGVRGAAIVYILSEIVLFVGYAWLVLQQHSQPANFFRFLQNIGDPDGS
jgi:O-antigen/teichoic acid export membrane protein